jgi:oxaloacetate decarboxylase alpha subunit
MNDAGLQRRQRAPGEEAGGEYVIAALVFTLSRSRRRLLRRAARTLAACADIDALYIKDPAGLLSPNAQPR